jgi:hypothetical protein
VYALAGQKAGKDKSRRASYENLPGAQNIPPLEVIHISSEVRQLYITGTPPKIALIPTDQNHFDRDDVKVAFGQYKISYGDVPYYQQEHKRSRENGVTSDRTYGWGERAQNQAF